MKKNNPKKPFFGDENKGLATSKGSRSNSGATNSRDEGTGRGKGKSFGEGKKLYDKKGKEGTSSSDSSKGRFFKGQQEERSERSSLPKGGEDRGEKRGFGSKFARKESGATKKWESKESSSFSKKPFGDKPSRFKKDNGSEKKFDPTSRDKKPYSERSRSGDKKEGFSKSSSYGKEKGFKKDFSSEKPSLAPGEKRVYKGRGKDQQPVYAVETKSFGPESSGEKRGFGKNRNKFVELNADRPEYNFDSLPQKKNKKESEDLIRLNKYVANSGICSRREADELILKGLVVVNGEVIKEMGYKVKKTDHVVFQGKKINPEKPVYVLLNKPKDFITTTEDPMERKTVMKLVENACEERIFPVGRLDRNTTGLLVFTNDGELAAKLSHPSNEIKKIYQVTLNKALTAKDEEDILEGLTLEDGDAKVDDLQVLSKDRNILGLEIHIGRNRIVRRIFAHLGYEVEALDRVMYAGLDKKDLKRGHYRFLSEQEVIRLKYYI
ncbi:MAG: pseudouridine synthase [Bacteroidetes bacterium]|nr:pseudouridine synthase [Bacteroidota bacterium]